MHGITGLLLYIFVVKYFCLLSVHVLLTYLIGTIIKLSHSFHGVYLHACNVMHRSHYYMYILRVELMVDNTFSFVNIRCLIFLLLC